MIGTIRKFSVEYKKQLYTVLYIYEQQGPKGLSYLFYCAIDIDGKQIFIKADEVTRVELLD
jgi:hypothetical protein